VHNVSKTKVISRVHCVAGNRLSAAVDRSCYEELVELATCPSCGKVTTSMKLLPCMDYCCLPCLQQLQQQQLSQQDSCSDMNCPSCGETFSVPQEGLEHLPSNVYVRAVVPARADGRRPMPRRDRDQASSCGACRITTTPAKLEYCKECGQYLCERCAGVHRNLRSTRSHHVVDERHRLSVDCDSLLCASHPTKSLQIFCGDCASLCCVACLRQVHRDHNWCDADQVSQRFSQQLNNDAETVGRAASRCTEEIQRLDDAEKMLIERVEAVKSQTDSQKECLIDAVEREVAQLHDKLSHTQKVGVDKLCRTREQIGKQKQILECFQRFCQTVVETGTVQEVIHVHGSIHKTDEELPLQQVTNDAEISEFIFTPVHLLDFLPAQAQHLVGSVSTDESITPQPTWNQLQSQLHQTLDQVDQLQHQMDDHQRRMTFIEEQLAEKTQLLEATGRELEQQKSLVVELERQKSDMASAAEEKENTIIGLREELEQKDGLLDESLKQAEDLGQLFLDTQQKYEAQLHDSELKLEKTTLDLCESEHLAGEFRAVVDQLNDRVQQLEQSLSDSVYKENEMESQLEDAWQQINEQSIIIEHVPPTAGQSYTL